MSNDNDLSVRRANLSDAKRALLQKRLQAAKVSPTDSKSSNQSIPKKPIDQPIPLSFAQQRQWFMEQLRSNSAFYNLTELIHLEGEIQVPILIQALESVFERQEVLRAYFPVIDGQVQQLIFPTPLLNMPIIDLSSFPRSIQQSHLQDFINQELKTPFDLSISPLYRCKLLKFSQNHYKLIFVISHMIADGWSQTVLIKELTTFYEAFLNNTKASLPDLTIQYADFAYWQTQHINNAQLQKELDYWKSQLASPLPILKLPISKRLSNQSFKADLKNFVIEPILFNQLKSLANSEGVTLYMVLLSALKALLYRYTSSTDIIIGTPVANRIRKELEPLVGHFLNSLALRTNLSGNPSFKQLLSRLRDVTLAAYANQEIPFEKIVGQIQPDRDLSRTPIFQIIFILQNSALTKISLPSLEMSVEHIDNGLTDYELFFSIYEQGDHLSGFLKYSTDLFEANDISQLLRHYLNILSAIVSTPDVSLSEIPLLSSQEINQIIFDFNPLPQTYRQDINIHHLFEAQVLENPNKIAIVFGQQEMSYQELNSISNRLTHLLNSFGIGCGDIVGVYMERSPDMIIALLAILKSGAAYVPMETIFPIKRVDWILSSLNVKVLLTQSKHLSFLDELSSLPNLQNLVCLDSLSFEPYSRNNHRIWPNSYLSNFPSKNLDLKVDPNDLAYIIFTSGSTGTPKGVMVRHKPVINLIEWIEKEFNLSSNDRVLFVTSLCFDLSVYDIFGLLACGGSIYVASEKQLHDPENLIDILVNKSITFWDSAPAVLQQVVPFLPSQPQIEAKLRLVFLSGDWIAVTLPDQIRDCFPNAKVISLGGATEATVWSNFFPISKVEPSWASIPYGKPIQNSAYYVLDENLTPCPINVPGDLYISGDCLSDGYINEPILTAEKFIPNPFSSSSGSRMYRTGDRARYWHDGNLEFLGRVDNQVKIRGFRVELGEIESLFRLIPAIKDVVVIAMSEDPSSNLNRRIHDAASSTRVRSERLRLVSYYVLKDSYSLSIYEIRSFLKDKLPDYMIPSAFIEIPFIPLTSNGKVDRRALPRPEAEKSVVSDSYIKPRNEIEEKIASVWSEILSLPSISVEDSFFDLGGHSLLLIRAVSRLRQLFSLDFPISLMFDFPTISQFAEAISKILPLSSAKTEVIAKFPREPFMQLSFAQNRLWFLQQLETNNHFYNILTGCTLSGSLNYDLLKESFLDIVERHEILRTYFVENSGSPYQVIIPKSDFLLCWQDIDISDLSEIEQQSYLKKFVIEVANRPFDLSLLPLFRLFLLRLSPSEHILLLVIHHIISDGWSLGIIIKDLAAIYQSKLDGTANNLADLPIQYVDFALWQKDFLEGKILESQLNYWKSQLKDAAPFLTFPTDHPRPNMSSFKGSMVTSELSIESYHKLQSFLQAQGVTLFMALLSVFYLLLYRYSYQSDISVGTPVAGRSRSELESLIGMFVNTLVLRVRLEPTFSFLQLIDLVKSTCLSAFDNQDVPFEKLVEELNPPRELNRSALFQVMFVLQNVPLPPLKLSDLTLSLLDLDNNSTKFDLTLYTMEFEGKLKLWLNFSTELFEESTAISILTHYQSLLNSAIDNPSSPISSLSFLSELDKKLLLVDWNNTYLSYPTGLCIHHFFEQQAEQHPNNIALVFKNSSLSFIQLNERANQLAHFLLSLNLSTEDIVAIYLDRSIDSIISMLAIIKAGGVFLPLDINQPIERICLILNASQAKFIISRLNSFSNFSASIDELCQNKPTIIDLDSNNSKIALANTNNPITSVNEKNLAYIIFTSGSTGTPKGVGIEHRNLVNYSLSIIDRFSLRECKTFATVSTFAADLGNTVIFGSLLTGGTLHIVSQDAALDAVSLAEYFESNLIDCLKIVPSHLSALLSANSGSKNLLPRKKLILGGESSSWELINKIKLLANCTIYNHYGPTETTVGVLTFELTDKTLSVQSYSSTLPLGHPISNTQVYILDSFLQPVVRGAVGELYISGNNLARGYLNDPILTEEKFITLAENNILSSSSLRLYKTGDLVRYLPSGEIEFLGRSDHQVKIRGFRVELGDITSALLSFASITQAHVLVQNLVNVEKQLVAYLTPKNVDISHLRSFLRDKLPDYMIPSLFVTLDAFPLNANGKIDLKALSRFSAEIPTNESIDLAPLSPSAKILVDIFKQVLNISNLSVYDNFFDLGGHSLLAIQVISRIFDKFSVKLPLRTIFEKPTISQLSLHLSSLSDSYSLAGPTPIFRQPRSSKMDLSFSQQRLWFLDQLQPNSSLYNVPGAIKLTGNLNIPYLKQSFELIVQRHEILRTYFTDEQGLPKQVIVDEISLAWEIIDLSHLAASKQEAEFRELSTACARSPFSLSTIPLFRLLLLQLSSTEFILLINFHHIIFDGWSHSLLIKELSSIYSSLCLGTSPNLPELPIQYVDFAYWQKEFLEGEVLLSQLNYWKEQLKDAPAFLAFPTDYPRASFSSFQGSMLSIDVPNESFSKFQDLLNKQGSTLFMGLLSVFYSLLYRYSQQNDISVGTPVAGRSRPELEALIGMFINTLTLRVSFEDSFSFLQLLDLVKSTSLSAFDNQEVPFEKLVEELNPPRELNRSPIFQVMFVLQNVPLPSLSIADLSLSLLDLDNGSTKFDLTLFAMEIEGKLKLWLNYSSQLFDSSTISRLLSHYISLLDSIISTPNIPISSLSFLSENDKKLLLFDWNNTFAPYPKDSYFDYLFQQQVELHPNKVAVSFQDKSLSFSELNKKSNQLAHFLLSFDIKAGNIVAICLERSFDLIISLLAIIKTGATYLPLDIELPKNRLNFMLKDSNADLVVTQQSLLHLFSSFEKPTISLEEEWEKINLFSHNSLPKIVSNTSSNIAYILYTSGSTGNPKATLISNNNLINYLYWFNEKVVNYRPFLLPTLSKPSFDASLKQLLAPLIRGEKVWVVSEETSKDPNMLLNEIQDQKDLAINCVPSLWESLLQVLCSQEKEALPELKYLLLGGETLTLSLLEQTRKIFPDIEIWNLYGPTEYTANATAAKLAQKISIGKPISNTATYILDNNLQPVPLGVIGNLYLAGDGLAIGYLNRPSLTDEKFISNPFSLFPNSKDRKFNNTSKCKEQT